eukprot:scaffold122900_cov48-Prasinocladus_malaysianus.AAC.1
MALRHAIGSNDNSDALTFLRDVQSKNAQHVSYKKGNVYKSAWTSGSPTPGNNQAEALSASQTSKTGLWRKTRVVKTLTVFGDKSSNSGAYPAGSGHIEPPPSKAAPTRHGREAQRCGPKTNSKSDGKQCTLRTVSSCMYVHTTARHWFKEDEIIQNR